MKLFRAKVTMSPFFELGDTMSKDEWLKQLNLDEERFSVLVKGNRMIEIETEITLKPAPEAIYITRKDNPFSAFEQKQIISKLTEAFPDLSALLSEKE